MQIKRFKVFNRIKDVLAREREINSLKQRIELWDGVYRQLTERTTTANSTYKKLAVQL